MLSEETKERIMAMSVGEMEDRLVELDDKSKLTPEEGEEYDELEDRLDAITGDSDEEDEEESDEHI